MSIGVRYLTVLSEFKPSGLTIETAEGKPTDAATDNYHYFLFDPEVARERDGPDHNFSSSAPSSDRSDHELFIRGNRIIWSMGSRVHKIYTTPNTALKACWCRMDATSDALLCVLQVDTLSLYSTSGEVVSIPLLYSIASIWPLPFGLLLQKSADGHRPVLSSGSLLNARELSRPNKEYGLGHYTSNQLKSFEPFIKEDEATLSSHLILRHPMEEPKATYIEERGKLSTMKDIEERTIWTSDVIPLMASYHKGKSQHSVWLIEMATNPEAVDAVSTVHAVTNEPFTRQFSFRRIWQGKCSQSAASKGSAMLEKISAQKFSGCDAVQFLHARANMQSNFHMQEELLRSLLKFGWKPQLMHNLHAISPKGGPKKKLRRSPKSIIK